jgi:hypothetical protein
MRPIYTLPLSTLLACGPLAPPLDATTAASSDTSDTTDPGPSPTTATPEPITTTTLDPTTTIDPTTTSSTTGENPFLIKPDSGPSRPLECDVFQQDCPPGQKCAPWADDGGNAWNATKCVDVTGDGAPGDPCIAPEGPLEGSDDCALGVFCWEVDDNNHGTCTALCSGTPSTPTCAPESFCAITSESVINLCLTECDPLLQDCSGDKLCIPTNDHFICVLDGSGEMGAVNDPCEFANACDQGLICLNTASASAACQQGSLGCCQPFCKFPNSPCPNPDQQCLQWFDPMMEIPDGFEDVGVCAIPA